MRAMRNSSRSCIVLGVPPRNFHLVLQAPTAALQPRLDKMKALAETRIAGTILMWVSPTPATEAIWERRREKRWETV